MESCLQLISRFAAAQGWFEGTQINLLTEFLERQCLNEELREFLEEVVEEEASQEEEPLPDDLTEDEAITAELRDEGLTAETVREVRAEQDAADRYYGGG